MNHEDLLRIELGDRVCEALDTEEANEKNVDQRIDRFHEATEVQTN
jgi:hypothetical protein